MVSEQEEFERQASALGLTVQNKEKKHYQIRGGLFLVDYYLTDTFLVCYHIQGTYSSQVTYNLFDLLEVPFNIPNLPKRSPRRQKREDIFRLRGIRSSILKRQKNICFWCESELSFSNSSLDHVIPLSRGGSYGLDNLVTSCLTCNNVRGDVLTVDAIIKFRKFTDPSFVVPQKFLVLDR